MQRRGDRVELLFRRAQDLHGNFYADTLPMDAIKRTRADAQLLLKLLKQANKELPRDAPMPADARYIERVRRRQRRAGA